MNRFELCHFFFLSFWKRFLLFSHLSIFIFFILYTFIEINKIKQEILYQNKQKEKQQKNKCE